MRNENGFTLIEVMVSIALLAFMMLGAFSGLIAVNNLIIRNTLRDEAVKLSSERLTVARNTPYINLASGTSTAAYTRQVDNANKIFSVQEVVAVEVTNVAKSVMVTVSWPFRGTTHSHVATTIVGNR